MIYVLTPYTSNDIFTYTYNIFWQPTHLMICIHRNVTHSDSLHICDTDGDGRGGGRGGRGGYEPMSCIGHDVRRDALLHVSSAHQNIAYYYT